MTKSIIVEHFCSKVIPRMETNFFNSTGECFWMNQMNDLPRQLERSDVHCLFQGHGSAITSRQTSQRTHRYFLTHQSLINRKSVLRNLWVVNDHFFYTLVLSIKRLLEICFYVYTYALDLFTSDLTVCILNLQLVTEIFSILIVCTSPVMLAS
jgi:hypothetical protein